MSKTDTKALAVLCGDLHLSHTAPAIRAEKGEGWYSVMKGYLEQLQKLADLNYNVPIVCAGDIFDRWDSPPQLINFAISALPVIWAVPGQHDLQNHNLQLIHHSAYWTLVEAGIINHLSENHPRCTNTRLELTGFPWGTELQKAKNQHINSRVKVAVVHKYVWYSQAKHFKAKEEDHIEKLTSLDGFDAVLFGDNHQFWTTRRKPTAPGGWGPKCFFNSGTLIRRKSHEVSYEPRIGILYSDGYITPYSLDTSKDRFVDHEVIEQIEKAGLDTDEFKDALLELGDTALNFLEAAEWFIKKEVEAGRINKRTQDVLRDSLNAAAQTMKKAGK